MQKVIAFFKINWFFILIILMVLIIVANWLIKPKTPVLPTAPAPSVAKIANYKSIVPGETTLDRVNELLGFPINISEEGDRTITKYASSNKYRHHSVISQNRTVVLVKEIVNLSDNKPATSITSEFSSAPYFFYRQIPDPVFNLYVYPQNGLAYIGHTDGTVREIWYFVPTDIKNFMTLWGEGYASQKPTWKNPY